MNLQKKAKLLKKVTFGGVLALCTQSVFSTLVYAQEPTVKAKSIFHQDTSSGLLTLNTPELQTALFSDDKAIIIALPLPSGALVNFELTPESVMSEGLAKKYPHIRTFSGVAVDNSNNTGRFDITSNGFHGMFYYNGERVFVEPENIYIEEKAAQSLAKSQSSIVTSENASPVKVQRVFNSVNAKYTSYIKENSRVQDKKLLTFHQPKNITQLSTALESLSRNKMSKEEGANNTESVLTTYRIAISAAAEYTEFNGGTVDTTMAEIITLVNRLNQIYQHDLAIKLELVENNDLLVFTDAETDPFNNNSDDGGLNTGVINSIIGSDNYDIGHVLNTDGGGLAVLGAVCHPIYKGDGVTGDLNPTNDAFYIDYVAHEIGHQFGAEHSFNGTGGACSGNRVQRSAYEVGSGSTIMSYAGLCDDQNLQSHSDAFFHARSIDQIHAYLESSVGDSCGIASVDSNNVAIVDAGLDYTIPARTPFKLSGTATDVDGDELSYSWQQFDLGEKSASLAEQVDDGTRPLFRAFLPNEHATRFFPQLSNVLTGTHTIGESLPTTNRDLNFRLMVFDQNGGVSYDETTLTVVDSGEAFSLNTPLAEDVWTESDNNISWQVAQTDTLPINCAAVDVLLSKNNGESFDITLANNISNNGNATLSIDSFCPNDINTAEARIKLVCSDNIFYAVNQGAFNINKALAAKDLVITSQQAISLVQGNSIELTNALFTYACEAADSITIQAGDNYTFLGQTVTPNSDFSGELVVSVVISKDNVSSSVQLVNLTVEAKTEPTSEPEAGNDKSSGSMSWLLLFTFALLWRQKRSCSK
ncbi:zinc-dependent metalloprotease family protein [Colwellia sp. 4_MG-2023]|uniref:reprolysin-like metallopeptidase n=1 Tax=unclassified Colwellia TaxID=196834 RepID=UPI0026E48679|nr:MULTISPECIES: zinc-dependent metalloprotease family protein [unclassified Colwellia]MDO6506107.1 zinc-dependent metalloprotease family protein [Colwellia sp. 5_MG-2023]MDO6554833.1 zinc-dependent metalloprotease family protein [Colwellia sp. 4_MG-2023]